MNMFMNVFLTINYISFLFFECQIVSMFRRHNWFVNVTRTHEEFILLIQFKLKQVFCLYLSENCLTNPIYVPGINSILIMDKKFLVDFTSWLAVTTSSHFKIAARFAPWPLTSFFCRNATQCLPPLFLSGSFIWLKITLPDVCVLAFIYVYIKSIRFRRMTNLLLGGLTVPYIKHHFFCEFNCLRWYIERNTNTIFLTDYHCGNYDIIQAL